MVLVRIEIDKYMTKYDLLSVCVQMQYKLKSYLANFLS